MDRRNPAVSFSPTLLIPCQAASVTAQCLVQISSKGFQTAKPSIKSGWLPSSLAHPLGPRRTPPSRYQLQRPCVTTARTFGRRASGIWYHGLIVLAKGCTLCQAFSATVDGTSSRLRAIYKPPSQAAALEILLQHGT
ncbi:hypothetical protein POX_a01475 [Penicillium oxalicum]|uniref:hypothetical protein n=1 Tax=Penicillium oxalicum TaxID=69781 RepID=UPI0020B87714|nr:hypothetical protein POX_a01475 [Penicillium oxalicum]KAI2794874.1 hypothetical protein POX_a01475 [Penicillium oxalicum]